MRRLVLIRHGRTEGSDRRLYYGETDLPLTPEGIVLAEAWGGLLERPLHLALSSPVGRCVDTARAILAGAERPDLQVLAD